MKRNLIGALIIAAVLMFCSMLSFLGTSSAAQTRSNVPPFASPSANRNEMINELRTITAEMKKQNALLTEQLKLLKSGKLQVVLVIDQKAGR